MRTALRFAMLGAAAVAALAPLAVSAPASAGAPATAKTGSVAHASETQNASTTANPCPGHRYRSTRSLVPLFREPRLDAPNAGYFGGDTCLWIASGLPGQPDFLLLDGTVENGRWLLASDVYKIG